jgi:hypothetical protein
MRGKHPCKETMLFANLLDIYTRKMLVRRQCRTVRLFTPFAFPKKNLATGKSIRYRVLRLTTILVPGTNSLHISFAEVMRENMKGSACCG